MTIVNYYDALPEQDLKHEDRLSLEIPSSPYGPTSTMMSSRRDSLVSLANLSMTSPLGTAGTNTPSSYTSFESAMRGMNTSSMTPEVSFSSSSCLNSNTIDDYDMSYLSQDYISTRPLCTWDNVPITDDPEAHSDIHLGMNDPQLQKDFYNTGNGILQEDSCFSLTAPLGLQSLFGSTIVPEQIRPNTALVAYQSLLQERDSYRQIILPQNLENTYPLDYAYPHSSNECSPSERQSSTRRNVKDRGNSPPKRRRVTTEGPSERSKSEGGHDIETEIIPSSKIKCPWPNCDGKFGRVEHMRRHLKNHVEKYLKEKDLLSKASDPAGWIALWPYLSVLSIVAKRTLKKAFERGISIPDEVLKKALEQFPTLRSEAVEDGPSVRCLVCNGKEYSRTDNLTQHYKNVHFSTKGGRLNRLITNDGAWKWDEIKKFDLDLRVRVEQFCENKEAKQRKDQGLVSVSPPTKRNGKGSRHEKKTAHRETRSRSSTAFSY